MSVARMLMYQSMFLTTGLLAIEILHAPSMNSIVIPTFVRTIALEPTDCRGKHSEAWM